MPINIKKVLKDGNWMLRRSDGGESYGGFQWNPVGEWTEAPDWRPTEECGHGLHGNGSESIDCYWTEGEDLDFCEYDPEYIVNLGDKIKVKRARILMRNQLPEGLKFGGSLNLEYIKSIKTLPKNLKIGGSLDLYGTAIKSLPDDLIVGGYLDIRDTAIKTLPDGLKVGGDIFIRNTPIKSWPEGLKIVELPVNGY